jgi:jumonji domain-containing protein 7
MPGLILAQEDILNHTETKFPLLAKTHPIKVSVSVGEMIYIPSLWYHRVNQTCETVGVNYWYDMKFDGPNWCYFNFLNEISSRVGR